MPRDLQRICPKFQLAMGILAKPWNGLIMAALEERPLRFAELTRKVAPIGDRILAARLKALVVHGIVTRQVFAGPPVRVEYMLTPAGHGFRAVQAAIGAWGAMLDLPKARTAAREKRPKARTSKRARKTTVWASAPAASRRPATR